MGMIREWEGMGILTLFPHTSTSEYPLGHSHPASWLNQLCNTSRAPEMKDVPPFISLSGLATVLWRGSDGTVSARWFDATTATSTRLGGGESISRRRHRHRHHALTDNTAAKCDRKA